MPERSLRDFARDVIQDDVERLNRAKLLMKMEEGYRKEAANPSLDPDWYETETDGW